MSGENVREYVGGFMRNRLHSSGDTFVLYSVINVVKAQIFTFKLNTVN